MRRHNHYYEVVASDRYELGLRLGTLFKVDLHLALRRGQKITAWGKTVDRARTYLASTEHYFPEQIEELKAVAQAAGVEFPELWTLSLEDEFEELEHCTTVVTNNGLMVAHNEDWEHDDASAVCLLKKTVGKLTVLELFYQRTMGENALSINSYGWLQAINSLNQSDRQVGIPRTIISRWLSETAHPPGDLAKFKTLPRSSGFNHIFVHRSGEVFNLESSTKKLIWSGPLLPFVHTNHYLSELPRLQNVKPSDSSQFRYQTARELTRPHMSLEQMAQLTADQSGDQLTGVFNKNTIARVMVDFKEGAAYVWLKREAEAGWLAYPLDFFSV